MDEAARRAALRMVPYGLYIGGAAEGSRVHAFLLSWLSQCSFKPPLVMAAINRQGRVHGMILDAKAFSVNLLDPSQRGLVADFLKSAVSEGDELAGHKFRRGATGAPVLEEAAAWLECRVLHHASLGDHTVIVAEVVEAGVRRSGAALTVEDTGWTYAG